MTKIIIIGIKQVELTIDDLLKKDKQAQMNGFKTGHVQSRIVGLQCHGGK